MNAQHQRRTRPVARRHQAYRIRFRRKRRNILHSNNFSEHLTPSLKKFYDPRTRLQHGTHRHHYGKRRRVLPSTRTRRRRIYTPVSPSVRYIRPVISDHANPEPVVVSVPEKNRKHHSRAVTAVIICLLAAAGISIVSIVVLHATKPEQQTVSTPSVSSVQETEVPAETPVPTPSPSPLHEELEPQIEAALSPLQGDWSCYVQDLHTGETITYNSHRQHSASLIKLYTAGCYEQELLDGTIQATPASEQNEAMMISYSDNDAWVALETAIGRGSYSTGHQLVHQFARSHGFSDTGRLVDQNDRPNGEGGMNWTSVTDTGRCLDEIYHGTYVSAEASAKILTLMKKQVHVNKIPAGLPPGTVCANKTGELDLTQNDSAIIYGPKTDYILVVMSDGMYNGDEAVQHIIDLSSMVWNYMEK